MKQETRHIYAPAVQNALINYNYSIHKALEAVQKVESITVTMRLSEMFGVDESDIAPIIQRDYLIETQ